MSDTLNIKLDSNIVFNDEIIDFLAPTCCFYKIEKDYKLKVCDKSYVYKNDIIMINREGMTKHSSISGKVLGVKDMLYSDNKVYPSLVIENDFKENIRTRKSAKKYLNTYTRAEFECILNDTNLITKDNISILNKLQVANELIINGLDIDAYFVNNKFIQRDYHQEILETCDVIGNLYNIDNIVILVPNIDSNLIGLYENAIGTYPNIKIEYVSQIYPYTLNEIIKDKYRTKLENIFTTEEIMSIHKVLKKQMPLTDKVITISGNAVNKSTAIKVKLGSLLSETFINNFDFTWDLVDVYLNGIIKGKKVKTLNYVVDANIDGIVINKQEKKDKIKCINCGLCSKICPKELNPKYVYEHNGMTKDEYKNSCIQCGMCNFVCPSNIDLRECMVKNNEDA